MAAGLLAIGLGALPLRHADRLLKMRLSSADDGQLLAALVAIAFGAALLAWSRSTPGRPVVWPLLFGAIALAMPFLFAGLAPMFTESVTLGGGRFCNDDGGCVYGLPLNVDEVSQGFLYARRTATIALRLAAVPFAMLFVRALCRTTPVVVRAVRRWSSGFASGAAMRRELRLLDNVTQQAVR